MLAKKLAKSIFDQARVIEFREVRDVVFDPGPANLFVTCRHPLEALGGYDFDVPLLPGEHVTDDAFARFYYHGDWYWIDHADLPSKRVFTLMLFMTTLTNRAGTENAPVLTIPTN